MPGLIPMFTTASIAARVNRFADQREKNAFMQLAYLGETAVNAARSNPSKAKGGTSFTDQSGNLRSSIGWIILKNGKVKKEQVPSPVGRASE